MALASGVYSLIGVGVGALVTGGAQWALAIRAERLRARAAKRFLADALLDAFRAYQLRVALGDEEEPRSADAYQLSLRAWEQHAAEAVVSLSQPEWSAVRNAFQVIAMERDGYPPVGPFPRGHKDGGDSSVTRAWLIAGIRALSSDAALLIEHDIPLGPYG